MTHKVAFSFADGKTLFCPVQNDEILLDAALRAGIKIPLDCREGVCGTCQGRCESGRYTQDYVDDEALSPADLAQGRMLTCQTRVHSDARFYFDFDSSVCHAAGPECITASVREVVQVSDSTALLWLDASQLPRQLDFLPGQYARMRVPGTDTWRAYSFANRPGTSNQLQFLVRLLPDGVMSRYLRERWQPGDIFELEAPLGSFYLRQLERPVVMAAGGTGLSAFLGMLDEMAESGPHGQPVTLFYGVNQEADLCELERLASYHQRIPGFTLHTVVNQPGEAWSGKRGYIPEHLDVPLEPEQNFDLYVCGPPPMVDAIKQWATDHCVTGARIFAEKFIGS
ncbi:anthranilate 1,2-dioxygenase electron transfer component AntC [Pseudomonas sp. TUM22785]|uniref:anthranilate 1,2-dioxygenase electron transfer component AntC n=1 Tax=Pseudomonas sp. TUM22785 TaxID=3019098 RepID=UPI002304F358|nr:anthranilate 1,2-dioxygenase electron transfer component AntC [Pseudomonas sp. TUM22785]WCD77830.1 anthranilate 1,2-dioxygenase electron transfer component AntC [Pseudomonas sp. TUM22785]